MNNYRNEFLIYEKHPDLIYFDSAATSLTPKVVVDEILNYYHYERSTVNRGESKIVNKNNQKYQMVRESIAKFLNANNHEIIFTKSTTSALNFLAQNLIEQLNPGDEIILSELEHHSNLLSFRERAKKNNIIIKYAPIKNLEIDYEKLEQMINEKTKIISLHHVSNVIGDKINLELIGNLCQKNNIIFCVDGAQGILHEKVDVKKYNIDFYVFSGHKIFGPTGIGVLYGKEKYLSDFIFEYGGDMADYVDKENLIKKPLPQRLEAGTPSISEVLALGKAIEFIEKIGITNLEKNNLEIRNYCLKKMQEISEIEIYNDNINTSIISFNLKDISVHDALACYAKYNISLRGGQMCNALSLELIKQNAILRISFNIYNTKKEVDQFIDVTKKIINDPLLWME